MQKWHFLDLDTFFYQADIMDVQKHIENCIRQTLSEMTSLSGGCVGDVYGLVLQDGGRLVAKSASYGAGLEIEGRMLGYLREHSTLKVPDVIYADETLLVMSRLEQSTQLNELGEEEAADQIAALHHVKADRFGLAFDTLIGGLHQPNPWTDDWFDFYGTSRLLYMAKQAVQHARLEAGFLERLEKLVTKLPEIAPPADAPCLLHGDLWGGNVLADKGRLSGFIDPAIYYGHREMDLAFSTLFHAFGQRFYDRYQEHFCLEQGFWEERCDLYNLYPLLVHVRLFGGSYVGDVDRILMKFGC